MLHSSFCHDEEQLTCASVIIWPNLALTVLVLDPGSSSGGLRQVVLYTIKEIMLTYELYDLIREVILAAVISYRDAEF